MKKIIAVILALMLVLSLGACSEKPEEHDHDHEHPEEPVPGTEEIIPEEQPEEIENIDAKRGNVENGVYYNEAFGIRFDGGSGWDFYSDEEIAEIMGISMETMLSNEYAEALKEATIIYDMYAVDPASGSTVNINYENVNGIYETLVDAEYYLEISKTQLAEQFSSFNVTKNEVSEIEINGGKAPCLFINIDFSGSTVYEAIIVKKIGNWFGIVTVSNLSEDALYETAAKVSF